MCRVTTSRFYHKTGNTGSFPMSGHRTYTIVVTTSTKEKEIFTILTPMITLVKPILFAFIKTTAVKELIVKLLEAYAKSTDNTVDDKLVVLVKKNLLPE